MTSQGESLLIFPAGYGDGPAMRAHAAALGLNVVGASSRPDDPERENYQTWTYLPHISDPSFDSVLAGAIDALSIGRVHASHYAVWRHLHATLPITAPGVELHLGKTNFDLVTEYRALRGRLQTAPEIAELANAPTLHSALSPAECAGFIRAAMAIPGESDEAKLRAVIEVTRRAPKGDIVEIGCLFGRTAALLAMLSDRYDLGRVLCVDPWSIQSTEQGNEQLREASQDYSWNDFREIFEINVAPFARGRLNYIHAPSQDGAAIYEKRAPIHTETFGDTIYEGAIGLLHIDGNHDYLYVLADTERWAPWVKPGGWIIFDDYVWDWGDGPKRVADAYLENERDNLQCAFVAGGALFVQRKNTA